jgi:tRNA A-37 threonylcarbamoyl transferase component Bud32/tetratricopeptide (TPR) repeat protein
MTSHEDHLPPRDVDMVRSAWANVRGARALSPISRSRWSIAGYDPVCLLPRGGQGIVYRAVQQSTGRSVAIKMLRHGDLATPAEQARFLREVQVLGQLRHPGIVTIFDHGEMDGAPFIVMDFIDGRPLDVYVADEQPDLDNLLRLFILIAAAVQAAHLNGVVHRDLKPANILVDDDGDPHIVDFGLAKTSAEAPDSTTMTRTGQILGSMPWIAPEQAAGRHELVDVRTDVYALGVILYHLVTGRFPYDVSGSVQELLRRISSDAPVPPRVAHRGVDTDLSTILLRCLAKERERRYQSAGELGHDIERYLNREAIAARRDSPWYLLRKSFRRHRAALAVSIGFVVLTLAALVVSTTQWRRAELELTRANEIRRVLFHFFSGIDPAVARGADTTLLKELMEDAEKQITPGMDPGVEAEVRNVLGSVYHSIDSRDAAAANFTRSIELRRRELGPDHPDTLDTMHDYVQFLLKADRFRDAEPLMREVVNGTRRRYGDDHQQYFKALSDFSLALKEGDHPEESLVVNEQALVGYRRTLGNDNRDTLAVVANRAVLLRQLNRLNEAEPYYRESMDGFRRLLGDEHPDTLTTMNNTGAFLNALGKKEEAEQVYREVYETRKRILGTDHTETLRSLNNLSSVLLDLERTDEAGVLLAEGLPVAREKWADTALLGLYLTKVGNLQIQEKRFDDARATLDEAYELLVAEYGENHRQTKKIYKSYVDLYTAWHAETSAEELQLAAAQWNARLGE